MVLVEVEGQHSAFPISLEFSKQMEMFLFLTIVIIRWPKKDSYLLD